LIAELGRGNTEKLTLMKKRNEQNESIVSMASEKYAIRKEIDESKLVSMHQQSLSDACQEIQVLKASQDCDTTFRRLCCLTFEHQRSLSLQSHIPIQHIAMQMWLAGFTKQHVLPSQTIPLVLTL
jgi:hypothetical protein